MFRNRLVFVAAALGATSACSSGMPDNYLDSDDGDVDTADGDTDADADADTDDAPAEFWSVDGDVLIAGGLVDPAASTLTLRAWAHEAVTCERIVPVETAEVGEAPLDTGAIAWWKLTVGAGEIPDPPCDFSHPPAIELGFAPPDPRLQPAMDERGLSSASAYSLLIGGDPVFVFGIAGTTDNLSGASQVDPQLVADGRYTLLDLHLLPVR